MLSTYLTTKALYIHVYQLSTETTIRKNKINDEN